MKPRGSLRLSTDRAKAQLRYERAAKLVLRWVLFAALAISVPLPFYFFVVGGFVTYVHLIAMTPSLHLALVPYLLVYGVLLYLGSGALLRLLRRWPQWQWRLAGTAVLLCVGVSLLPIFALWHDTVRIQNAYSLLVSLFGP